MQVQPQPTNDEDDALLQQVLALSLEEHTREQRARDAQAAAADELAESLANAAAADEAAAAAKDAVRAEKAAKEKQRLEAKREARELAKAEARAKNAATSPPATADAATDARAAASTTSAEVADPAVIDAPTPNDHVDRPARPAHFGTVIEPRPLGTVVAGAFCLSGRPPPSNVKDDPAGKVKSFANAKVQAMSGKSTISVATPGGEGSAADLAGTGLSYGVKQDFGFLRQLMKGKLSGAPRGSVGGPHNEAASKVLRRALANQPAWAGATSAMLEFQPLAVACYLGKPEYLSASDLELATALGMIERGGGDGNHGEALRLCSVLDGKTMHLMPLIRACVEPSEDCMANYALGLDWLRQSQVDRSLPAWRALQVELVHATALHELGNMHTVVRQIGEIHAPLMRPLMSTANDRLMPAPRLPCLL